MRTNAMRSLLLAATLGSTMLLGACAPLAIRKPPEPVVKEEAKPKKSPTAWLESLRDDRALQVERDFQGS
jgi:hypothetical protein